MGDVTAKANPPTPGSKYRIKVGQTIGGLVWSNVAYTVDGHWTIIYDDGQPDFWPISQSASGSSRAAVLWKTDQIAKKNGWVVGGVVFGGSTSQRGQSYVQAFVLDANITPASITDYLAMGYAYASKPVEFGTFVEPGPAGGPGAITRVFLATTAGGGAAGKVLFATPTGAIWRIIMGTAIYTSSATVGTRSIQPRFRDASGNVYQFMGILAPTATQTARYEFAPNLTSLLTVGLGTNLSSENPSPDRGLPTGYDLFENDATNVDVADTVSAEVQVEEWVMPN